MTARAGAYLCTFPGFELCGMELECVGMHSVGLGSVGAGWVGLGLCFIDSGTGCIGLGSVRSRSWSVQFVRGDWWEPIALPQVVYKYIIFWSTHAAIIFWHTFVWVIELSQATSIFSASLDHPRSAS